MKYVLEVSMDSEAVFKNPEMEITRALELAIQDLPGLTSRVAPEEEHKGPGQVVSKNRYWDTWDEGEIITQIELEEGDV
jgi:hypothetical protein